MSFDDQGNKIEGEVDGGASTQNFQSDQDTQKVDSPQTVSPSQQQIEEKGREETIYEATHGPDRASYRDENWRFTSSDQPGARLHFTPSQVESARIEMEEDLARKKFEEETTRALAHQEALDSNTKANEGFQPLRQSDGFKKFIDTQEEEAKRAAAHQQPEEQPNITKRVEEVDLGEMNKQLSEVNQRIQNLLEGHELSQLSQDELLEYLNLFQEQSRLQSEIAQATINRLRNNMEMAASLLISNNNQTNINLPPVPPTPIQMSAEVGENQLPQKENTPEQRSAALGRQLLELETKLANGGLTDEEKIQYFDLMNQKREIDKQINDVQQESERKRKNKEKWIKIAAGVVGAGVAFTTPAIGCAAVLGVTLGGRMVGKGLQSISTKLRTKSTAIKYELREGKTKEQLDEMDKRQKRNAWWANRLGEASAILIGGATGYGLGSLFEGIVGKDFYVGMNNQPTPQIPTGAESQPPIEQNSSQSPEITEPTSEPGITTSQASVLGEGISGESFNASDFGWDYNQMGWLGDKVYLTDAGGNSGILQGNFFTELSKLVPRDLLMGQESGNIVNQFLRATYGGMNPTEAAGKAAELILGK